MSMAQAQSLAKTPRRRWWRFLVQFSLRMLLIATTLAAVGCWWFLQQETREEQIAGKYLKLRRQVRAVKVTPAVTNQVDSNDVVLKNVGSWRLLDEHGDPLVVGRYHDDLPQGRWTVYHTNGRKAAEGSVVRGARNGLWRVWDAEGRLESEVTYLAVEPKAVGGGLGRARPFVGEIGRASCRERVEIAVVGVGLKNKD